MAVKRVGARANAQIRLARPVGAVVLRAPAGEAGVADFVGIPALGAEVLAEPEEVLAGARIVRRSRFAALDGMVQGGALLDRERIGRKVGRPQVQGHADVVLPFAQAGAGEAIDEVQADVFKSSVLGAGDAFLRLTARVGPVHPRQTGIHKGLNPHAQTVNAQATPCREVVGR